jgi:hypothetical protein
VDQFLFEQNSMFKQFLLSKPTYKAASVVTVEKMRSFWKSYLKEKKQSAKDPWGGSLNVDSSGQIVTTTPHEAVFSLDGAS